MKFPLIVNSFEERDTFGHFLTGLGFGKETDIGVEVGVHRGIFAKTLLLSWNGFLNLVDPYYSDYDSEEIAEVRGDRSNDLRETRISIHPHLSRCRLILQSSVDASKMFENESLCFVYVDACHQYKDTKEDIETWWPKIKKGGILAGHDIISRDGESKTSGWGRYVQPAVFEFALEHDLTVFLVTEKDGLPWSYYFVKG